MRIEISLSCIAGATLACLIGGTAAAGDRLLTIGVENNQYMPAYSYEDGEYKGFARAVLDAFAKDKGYRFEYRAMPVVRLFTAFVNGEVDLKFPDNAMWSGDMKKDKTVTYSDPVVAYVDGVSVRPDRKGQPADSVKSLGLVRGFTAWDWQDRLKAGAVTLHENNNFTALLETAIAGRNDGAYANVAVVNHQLDKVLGKPGALAFDPTLPHTRSHYHLSSIKHPDVIGAFNGWLAANRDLVAGLKVEFGVEKGIN